MQCNNNMDISEPSFNCAVDWLFNYLQGKEYSTRHMVPTSHMTNIPTFPL